MRDNLDRLLDRLADAPGPQRLDRLEFDLSARLADRRARTGEGSWRIAAIGLALMAGLGVGGAAALPIARPGAAGLPLDGASLAPSALLNPSR